MLVASQKARYEYEGAGVSFCDFLHLLRSVRIQRYISRNSERHRFLPIGLSLPVSGGSQKEILCIERKDRRLLWEIAWSYQSVRFQLRTEGRVSKIRKRLDHEGALIR
jgi:hypothetical protein